MFIYPEEKRINSLHSFVDYNIYYSAIHELKFIQCEGIAHCFIRYLLFIKKRRNLLDFDLWAFPWSFWSVGIQKSAVSQKIQIFGSRF